MVLSWLFLCLIGKNNRGTEWNHLDFFQVSYNTLLKATDGFSSANLIGVGSFGSVYKVVLDTPSQLAAVKVFNMLHRGASKSFMAECEMFRNIRHHNIVKIVTACSSVDFRGNDFKALVYEFMENGSLEEWLHPTTGTQKVRNVTKNLSFVERLNIAIDVACALDYLHNHCHTPIVHCDLKPSNILLDDDLTGRVSDFGLARFLSKPNNVSTNQTSVIGLRGSVSYVAPEYKMGSEASTYGDVYSFGILLLELFTGKKPSDDMFSDGLNLRDFVKTAFFYGVAEMADSRLLLQGGNDNPPSKCSVNFKLEIEEYLRLIFEIGIVCSRKSPRDRMSISFVVSELQSIRDDFLNRLDSYSQTAGLRSILCSIENKRSRLCSSCIVYQSRMNKQTGSSSSNRCNRQFCASRLLSHLYEVMDNGSLEVWLHPSTGTEDVRDAPKNLSLIQRLEIAINVACALDFLHNSHKRPIVYCDLNPSNVLLDKELIGHVYDFGLERCLSKRIENVFGNQSSSIGIIGSVGYAAPEYSRGSEVSTYGDVYSFGILLLEMFTSKRPTDHMFSVDGLNLRSFVEMAIPERVIEIADSRLLLQRGTNDKECLISIFRLGITCSAGALRDRMNISHVVPKLHVIRDRLLA